MCSWAPPEGETFEARRAAPDGGRDMATVASTKKALLDAARDGDVGTITRLVSQIPSTEEVCACEHNLPRADHIKSSNEDRLRRTRPFSHATRAARETLYSSRLTHSPPLGFISFLTNKRSRARWRCCAPCVTTWWVSKRSALARPPPTLVAAAASALSFKKRLFLLRRVRRMRLDGWSL